MFFFKINFSQELARRTTHGELGGIWAWATCTSAERHGIVQKLQTPVRYGQHLFRHQNEKRVPPNVVSVSAVPLSMQFLSDLSTGC